MLYDENSNIVIYISDILFDLQNIQPVMVINVFKWL